MRGWRVAVALLVLCGVPAPAANASGFTFHGRPIDPRCVAALVPMEAGAPQPVELARCTKSGKVTHVDSSFEVEEPDPAAVMGTPFDSYEILGRDGARFAIATLSSGGGTGRFTDLMIVRKSGARLVAEKILLRGTDRCNGGLWDAKLDGSLLIWSENLTPSDLIEFGGIKSLTAYKDLEASASSCVATRNMAYDMKSGDAHMVSITLQPGYGQGNSNGRIEDREGWTEQYAHQHCFNTFYNGYVFDGRTELDPAQLKAFADGFASACLVKKP